SRGHHRDSHRLVGRANACASIVRRDATHLHRDLSAPRQRRAEAVVLSAPMTRSLALTLNALGLCAIALVLAVTFAAQLLLDDLPCPLCLLQRIQFAMLAAGPILTLRFGPRPSHYAVSLFAAIAGAAFATRQILLHIMPGDPGYGSA